MRTSARSAFLLGSGCLAVFCCIVAPDRANAGDPESGPKVERFSYGKQGLQFDDGTGDNFLWFGVRLQTRGANEEVTQDDVPGAPTNTNSELGLNRGRLKLGGHLVSPRFTIYSEYDFVDNRLLDLRATYKFTDWMSIRIGQWKAEFNRERIDSSGKQQFVERSVATPWFTIDRQQGVMASGRVASETSGDTSYWFGWLSGAGRGGDTSDADGLWLARVQWNVLGRVLGFSQSATSRPGKPMGSVAVAAVSGKSAYTAFSSQGGGQLPGFDNGDPDQYRIEQIMIETAYQHRGFSWQQEFHWKEVLDRATGQRRRLVGGYAQAGVFFSEWVESFPEPLEFALRFARVDPDRDVASDTEKEFTLGSNWFFNGHRNKLSLDLPHVVRLQAPETDTSNRVRLQWDWSF
jgi:phosphate-selective porin